MSVQKPKIPGPIKKHPTELLHFTQFSCDQVEILSLGAQNYSITQEYPTQFTIMGRAF